MQLRLLSFLFVIFLFFTPLRVNAISDPLTFPNNKFGVHIFDPEEIDKVADLVNGNGGEWGYVTVPIRSDDRNREKWQLFMKKCQQNKIIPILRLSTTMQSYGWSKPGTFDAIDFANFLNDLDWPVKNRYVIVYNEPNHATEWGGTVDPENYAQVLLETIDVFKDRNDDFFMLPAGIDVACGNVPGHMHWKTFIQTMQYTHPDALPKIDGWNSHSYPNPAFSSPPSARHDRSIYSFSYETALIKQITGKDLPIFITETGWSNENMNDQTIAQYYLTAFNSVWNNSRIITITPFVLQANAGPFEVFSLLKHDGNPKPQYLTLKYYPKTKGEPLTGTDPQPSKLQSVLGEANEATHSSLLEIPKEIKEIFSKEKLDGLLKILKPVDDTKDK